MRTENQMDWQEAYDCIYMGMQFTKRREALGLDAETVAEQAGYSITQYKLMEEGKRLISVTDYFRVADVWYAYEDADYPAFERKRRKIWRSIKREFYVYELQIEHVIPPAKPVFDRIPLRLIVAVILISGPLLILLGDLDIIYHLGYALGWFYRMVGSVVG